MGRAAISSEVMGYDITSFLPRAAPADPASVALPRDEGMTEASYYQTRSGSSDARALLEALDAVEHDGGVSGKGIGRYFTRDQIRDACRRLCLSYLDGCVTERPLRFIMQTAEALREDQPWVYIEFA